MELIDKIAALNSGPLSRASLQSIYREIMSASKALQRDISVAYLGPPGSYTHQAAMSMFGRDSAGPRSTADATAPGGLTYTPQDCIKSVFTALAGGTTYAVVPFENRYAFDPFSNAQRFWLCAGNAGRSGLLARERLYSLHHCAADNPLSCCLGCGSLYEL